MGRFPLHIAIFSFLVIVTAFLCLNYSIITNPDKEEIKNAELLTNTEKSSPQSKEKNETTESENTPANSTLRKISKYILKYNENGVFLTTFYENGKEISSPIPDINIDYLTEIDRDNLIRGIELETREEVFMLIEDFSS